MLVQEVAKKYAHGLFLSVKGKGLVDQAHEQLADLGKCFESDRSLLNFLEAPHILDEDKLAIVRDVFTPRMDRLFVEFLIVLVDKHRIDFLPEIIDEFIRYVEADKGIGRATVITAVPLDQAQREALLARLVARSSLKIVLEEKVDRAVIGGMIIIMHNQIIDGSIRRQLDEMKEQLSGLRVY